MFSWLKSTRKLVFKFETVQLFQVFSYFSQIWPTIYSMDCYTAYVTLYVQQIKQRTLQFDVGVKQYCPVFWPLTKAKTWWNIKSNTSKRGRLLNIKSTIIDNSKEVFAVDKKSSSYSKKRNISKDCPRYE